MHRTNNGKSPNSTLLYVKYPSRKHILYDCIKRKDKKQEQIPKTPYPKRRKNPCAKYVVEVQSLVIEIPTRHSIFAKMDRHLVLGMGKPQFEHHVMIHYHVMDRDIYF